MNRSSVLSQYAIVLGLFVSFPTGGAGPRYSQWNSADNLGCTVNSPFDEAGPAISKDGLSLFFGSNRPGGLGNFDLYVSQRASIADPWGAPVNLGLMINTNGVDNIPSLSRDEHWLFFNSDRPKGSFGNVDVWASWRRDIHDDFGWEEPINVGSGINTTGFDAGAGYFEDGPNGAPLLYFGRGATMATTDIYVSEGQPDGTFGTAVLVPELTSAANDQRPQIRHDGLELFLFSNRSGSISGSNDLWVSTRDTVFDAWSSPTALGAPVNTAAGEMHPYIAEDRRTLYFTSNRPGFCVDAEHQTANIDLYVTTRQRVTGRDGHRD
jgi:WD40-like Beta Propeller Repeat